MKRTIVFLTLLFAGCAPVYVAPPVPEGNHPANPSAATTAEPDPNLLGIPPADPLPQVDAYNLVYSFPTTPRTQPVQGMPMPPMPDTSEVQHEMPMDTSDMQHEMPMPPMPDSTMRSPDAVPHHMHMNENR